MSVSLLEVIEAAGYDLSTLEDAQWLLSRQSEFEDLIEKAQEDVDAYDEETSRLEEIEYRKAFPEVE